MTLPDTKIFGTIQVCQSQFAQFNFAQFAKKIMFLTYLTF